MGGGGLAYQTCDYGNAIKGAAAGGALCHLPPPRAASWVLPLQRQRGG
jgi:hypothetical protein